MQAGGISFIEWALFGVAAVSAAAAFIILSLHLFFKLRDSKEHRSAEEKQLIMKQEQQGMRKQAQAELRDVVEEGVSVVRADVQKMTEKFNAHMEKELTRVFNQELEAYKKSATNIQEVVTKAIQASQQTASKAMQDSQQIASQSIQDSRQKALESNKSIDGIVAQHIEAERQRVSEKLDKDIAGIVKNYLEEAMSDSVVGEEQIDAVIRQLESKKQLIIEEMRSVN